MIPLQKLVIFLGIKTIGTKRFPKYQQHLILTQNGILTPEMYCTVTPSLYKSNRGDYLHVLLHDLNKNEEIILKSNDGARGLGQILLRKEQLYNLFDNSNDKEYLKNHFNLGGLPKNEFEDSFLFETIETSNFIISKKINDIVAEYRVIGFYGIEPIVIERKITDHWQSNISITGEFKELDSSVLSKELLDNIQGLLKKLNTPFLSIDVFKREDGSFGVFEFQMQFGYKSPDKDILIDKTNLSIKNIINS